MAAGLYVHVPFCVSKCPYCDFYSVVAPERVDALLDDLQTEADLVSKAFGPFDSLYIGGGTPSCLPPAALARLLALTRSVVEAAGPAGDLELSVECNPADVGPDLLSVLEDAGVSRISLGVQAFDDAALAWLGRRHDRAGAERAIEAIRAAGFGSLSLDLIYGLPRGLEEGFPGSLAKAVEFGPDHLSCYSLTVADRTPLGQRVAAGQEALPDEDCLADRFTATSVALGDAGYEHYEVSNFARGPEKRSCHNQKYWTREPVLGLGPAAHSFDGRSRWANWADLYEYHEALSAGLRPVESLEELTVEQVRLERLALGLRTVDGVALSAIGPDRQADIDRAVAEGLATITAGHLRPTRQGMLVADGLARTLC